MMQRIGLLAVVSLIFLGCTLGSEGQNNANYFECYSTIDGTYSVHVVETEDTCDPVAEPIDYRTRLEVVVQSETENGGYLVDVYLSNLSWWDVEVAPDGTLDNSLDIYDGLYVHRVVGLLTPEGVDLVLELNTMGFEDGKPFCAIHYTVVGYPLFCRATPPEDMENELGG